MIKKQKTKRSLWLKKRKVSFDIPTKKPSLFTQFTSMLHTRSTAFFNQCTHLSTTVGKYVQKKKGQEKENKMKRTRIQMDLSPRRKQEQVSSSRTPAFRSRRQATLWKETKQYFKTLHINPRYAVSLAILISIIGGIFFKDFFIQAATYTFNQTSWIGGTSGDTASHTGNNQTNWTNYTSQTGITAGTTIELTPNNYTFTDDETTSTTSPTPPTGGGFGSGTNSQTTLSGGSISLGVTP